MDAININVASLLKQSPETLSFLTELQAIDKLSKIFNIINDNSKFFEEIKKYVSDSKFDILIFQLFLSFVFAFFISFIVSIFTEINFKNSINSSNDKLKTYVNIINDELKTIKLNINTTNNKLNEIEIKIDKIKHD
jgi:hypothetical protein